MSSQLGKNPLSGHIALGCAALIFLIVCILGAIK